MWHNVCEGNRYEDEARTCGIRSLYSMWHDLNSVRRCLQHVVYAIGKSRQITKGAPAANTAGFPPPSRHADTPVVLLRNTDVYRECENLSSTTHDLKVMGL